MDGRSAGGRHESGHAIFLRSAAPACPATYDGAWHFGTAADSLRGADVEFWVRGGKTLSELDSRRHSLRDPAEFFNDACDMEVRFDPSRARGITTSSIQTFSATAPAGSPPTFPQDALHPWNGQEGAGTQRLNHLARGELRMPLPQRPDANHVFACGCIRASEAAFALASILSAKSGAIRLMSFRRLLNPGRISSTSFFMP